MNGWTDCERREWVWMDEWTYGWFF